MKKVILSTFALSVLFMACEKDVIVPDSEITANEQSAQTISNDADLTTKANGRIWFDNGEQPGVDGEDYGCDLTGGNCLDEVVVVGLVDQGDMGDVIDEIRGGDAEGIIDLFESNETMLDGYIDPDLVDKVISEYYTVSCRGIFGTSTSAYLKFYDGTTLQNVTPLQKR